MKKYECLYIIDATFNNDVISEITTKFENLTKDNTKEFEINNWGNRKLAYEVNKKWNGYYSLITFRSKPDFIYELERQLRLNEKIIKFLITVVDEKKIINKKKSQEELEKADNNYDFMNFNNIWEFVNKSNINDLDIIKKSISLNKEIAMEGLKYNYGLCVGKNISMYIKKGLIGDDIANRAMALTAAACDARMGGISKSVMSNSGSGNQGVLATLPLVAISEKLGITENQLIRGVLLSHLITIYIKSKFGVLSAICGAIIAGTGASCGITYLLGGNLEAVKYAVQNMLGNVTGMICDGAKAGCALKISTCTNAAVQAALLAVEGLSVCFTEGIVEADPEKTINNVCNLANDSTIELDKIILNIMSKKCSY